MQANDDFICPICGQSDWVASVIVLQANYGSCYDGEELELHLCGECFDFIYESLKGED